MVMLNLLHNEEVGLESDHAFRGYYAGRMEKPHPELGAMVMLVVKDPGKTGLTLYANKPFPLADVRLVHPAGGRK